MKIPFFDSIKKAGELKKEKENMQQVKADIMSVSASGGEKAVYNYFHGEAIIDSLSMSSDTARKAKELIKKSQIHLENVTDDAGNGGRGYYIYDIKPTAQSGSLHAKVDSKDRCNVYIEFDKFRITRAECDCNRCFAKNRRNIYFNHNENCEHVVAATFLLNAYLETHELGDETNFLGSSLLSHFEDEVAGADRSFVRLVPKLIINKKESIEPHYYLVFKVGHKKLIQIKDFRRFVQAVDNGEIYPLGKNDEVRLVRSGFDAASEKYLKLIFDMVENEDAIKERYRDIFKSRLGSSRVRLDSTNIDRVFEVLKGENVDLSLENMMGNEAYHVDVRDFNDKFNLEIKPIYDRGNFAGVELEVGFFDYLLSNDYVYYFTDGYLNRGDTGLAAAIRPFVKSDMVDDVISIGRKNLGKLYSVILPRLEAYANIIDNAPEALDYIPENAKITYYLDMYDGKVLGRAEAGYRGGRVDIVPGKILGRNVGELIRNVNQEKNALEVLKRYLPHIDEKGNIITMTDDELYRLKTEGIDMLNKYGKVLGSEEFEHIKVYKKPSASIGVSVKSNLLQLELLSKDVTAGELADIVMNYRKKKKYYRLRSGAFIDMESEDMAELDEMLDVLQISTKELRRGALTVPLYRSIYLKELMQKHRELVEKRDDSFEALTDRLENIRNTNFSAPDEVEGILRGYQKEGFKWLRTVEEFGFGGILADDMGLGKTLQIIALLLDAKKGGRLTKALIVCPASLVYNWSEEIARFDCKGILSVCVLALAKEDRKKSLESSEIDVYITSYDTLRRDIAFYAGKSFSHQIIDEAQFIKNQTTGAAKAVKVVDSKVRFALTGTPVENRLSELWSIFDYTMPGFLYTYTAFRAKYERLIVKDEKDDVRKLLGRMISPFVLRRLKSEVAIDLPEKIEEVRVSKFEKKQQLVYDAELARLKRIVDGGGEYNANKMLILAQITRLRQICCDPSLALENYGGGSAKLETCIDLIRSAVEAGHKILLFSQFTSMLDIIEERLDAENITHFVITGSTPKESRLELVNTFNRDDTNVFLISLKAGGTGLNLVGADIVIHYDPWWNIAAQNQATDRAHRIGQKNMVTVYKLIAKGTIEERIVGLQESKRDLADRVLSFEEGLSLATISREELIELLG